MDEADLPELSVEEASLVAAQWVQYKTYAREAAWDPILRLNYWRCGLQSRGPALGYQHMHRQTWRPHMLLGPCVWALPGCMQQCSPARAAKKSRAPTGRT